MIRGESWPEYARMPLEHVADAYADGTEFLRALLECLARTPDVPILYEDIEGDLEWPRGRLRSVLGGYANKSKGRWGQQRPFHIFKQTPERWWIWMDADRAAVIRRP